MSYYKSPYPWFGGKLTVAETVWQYLGDVKCYIEPFYGSGAVHLNRPQPFDGVETINDFDGFVANFWRAVQAEPEKVADFADWPVNENDLHARHVWLVERKERLQARLEGDPDWFDAKVAGWWVWGMALWIGSGFCSGEGPWGVQEVEGVRRLVRLGNAGRGVNRQRVHLSAACQGVNRKRVHLSDASQAGLGERGLLEWIRALSERFRRVRVCCGDWTRVCGGNSGDAMVHFFAAGEPCGIFLDPPYTAEADRDATLYRKEDLEIGHAVQAWALAHGDDPRLRICVCGYEGEYEFPNNWKKFEWKASGGMALVSKNGSKAQDNAHRERLWFSPHCTEAHALPLFGETWA